MYACCPAPCGQCLLTRAPVCQCIHRYALFKRAALWGLCSFPLDQCMCICTALLWRRMQGVRASMPCSRW